MMDVDDDFANAEGLQARERDFQERAAINFDQRFGKIVCKWPQARAEAGGENHGFH